MLNRRSLYRRRYDVDVSSYLNLCNDTHAARIRLLISVVSCSSNVTVCPRYFADSFTCNTSTLMLSIETFFLLSRSLVAENSRLFWVDVSPTLSVLFLKSHRIPLSCSSDAENSSKSSSNRVFVGQSACCSPGRMPLPFSCHRFKWSVSAASNAVLNYNLFNGSPCFVPLFISNTSLSLSVETVAFWSAYSLLTSLMYCGSIPNCSSAVHNLLCLIVSNTFAKSTVATRILIHHSRHLCSSILYVAR